jgi:hypothetical protein
VTEVADLGAIQAADVSDRERWVELNRDIPLGEQRFRSGVPVLWFCHRDAHAVRLLTCRPLGLTVRSLPIPFGYPDAMLSPTYVDVNVG